MALEGAALPADLPPQTGTGASWLARGVPNGAAPDLEKRIRMGNAMALVMIGIAAVYLVAWMILDVPAMAALCVIMGAGAAGSLFLIRRGQHYAGRMSVVVNGLLIVFIMAVYLGPRANYQVILLNGVTLPVVLITAREWRTRWALMGLSVVSFAVVESQLLGAEAYIEASDLFFRIAHANGGLVSLFFLGVSVEMLTRENLASESKLKQALARSDAVVTQMADGLLAADASGAVQFVNPAFWRLMGLEAGMLSETQHLPDELRSLLHKAMDTGDTVRAQFKLPKDRYGAATASPVGDEESLWGAVVLVRDVTMEHQVDRMKSDFIAAVSHELRTPLTSLLGFTALVRKSLDRRVFPLVPEDDKRAQKVVSRVRGNLEIMQSEGTRLGTLINDVLDLSKMESGRMEWVREPISVSHLLRRSAAATSALFTEKPGVVFEVEEEKGIPDLVGDFDRLLQVLINLISNAAKFTDEGTVTLIARNDSHRVLLIVKDTGVGIAKRDLAHVFQKFNQRRDEERRRGGTGLGLPISREIAQAHGGDIHAASTPGAGSTFTVWLPAALPSGALSQTPAPVPRQ